ncbi:hypothetical protein BJ875DRAFT_24846 [Amylocarpus encephaloides]|uniref:Signal transduction histidine kinase dimerisation/phosphoacceptor domain-containing protein n=1 Tax=Amylocarpus encephaloides TaxID=45428 RepID=A0A9P7YS73_9HELO|nr:hypothetical protein BJ875DRAFT_24846 [Amylocarpus encephaloides]
MPSREAARAREVYRYYQPKSQALPDPIDTFSNSPSTTNASCPTSEAHLESVSLEGFSDTALTAFAQLIAIRLNCQRAVISLIDHETEYLLAESPATFSASHDANQDTWASKRRNNIPRHASLCEEVINLVSKSNLSSGARPTCSVLDLQLHEKLQALECVKQAPNLRFFCGVPLTNNNGITIGCVYVVDDQPRQQNVSGEQSLFLQEMTVTVMDHLENNRAKEDVAMVTQMSQALHAFIEGDGTMKGDWERLKKYNLPGAGAGYHWESNNHDTNATHGVKSSSPTVEISMPDGYDGGLSPGQSPLQHPTSTHDVRAGFNNSPWASTSEVPQLNTAKDRLFANNGFSNLLHTTFARASNLVREGMMVDGAVFFDAPFRFYQARSTLEADLRRIDSSQDTDSSSDEGNEDGDAYTSPQVRPRPHPHMTAHESHRSDETDHSLPSGLLDATSVAGVKADILGFSTHKSSSWDNSEVNPTDNFKAIEQSLLTALVRRYPKGSLFTFDEDGPRILPEVSDVVESQAAPTASLKGRKHSRHIVRVRAELELLLEAFPAARSILFIPLYDATSGCFIGSFAWSTSPTQCFSVENHLSYLVAFGHSVMSTVSQLNTLSADHAKGDFISNVSHELRSPLHGVLASVEFLADTALDGFQRNLVETVDICGRTLLDTIEHVLDFSKIKKFGKETAQPMGAVSNLDISAVIEEVIQGVYAGFEFNGLSSQGLADRTSSHNRSSTPVGGQRTTPESNRLPPRQSRENPAIILDMDFREQWVFPTVSGTWRRLTMNLFGNALKYTSTGFIKIKLEARNLSPSKQLDPVHAIQKTMVTLTISDSGQGMSTDFMKTKLFMPFSQVWILISNLYILGRYL